MLDIRRLTVGYGKREVLRDLSLDFPKGTVTALLGPNGSGKSTLLKAAAGLLPRRAGEVLLDGRDTTALGMREVAKRMAYLSQGQETPDMTVARLVLHGRFPYLTYPGSYTREDRAAAAAAMARVGISDLGDTPLSTLSGGMRQTAYLAMALAREASFVLLDEPTTYLDVGHQVSFMRLLRDIAAEGRVVVAVMHDLPLALTYADRVAVLKDGALRATGLPCEILQSGVIEEVFGIAVAQAEGGFYCLL